MAFAQDDDAATDPDIEDDYLEEVIVTGSRIKRRDFSSPSPITTIEREAFEFSGQPTMEEYLNQMPISPTVTTWPAGAEILPFTPAIMKESHC